VSEDCFFCAFPEKQPDLVVHRGQDWSVFHVSRRWPLGSVFIVANDHVRQPEASAADWSHAAPILSAAHRVLIAELQAERSYLFTFQEEHNHFHFVMMPKSAATRERYSGATGAALMQAVLADGAAFDRAAAAQMAAKLREPFARVVATATTEPNRRGMY
jgi:diadenosine tetraphosphate (Ap4A) HIT family hydrolase